MSKYILTVTGIDAILKGQNIIITATFPDDTDESIKVSREDVLSIYGITPQKFMEQYGENENVLTELFTAQTGVMVNEKPI